jgi:iron complex outermembrane receptor protein
MTNLRCSDCIRSLVCLCLCGSVSAGLTAAPQDPASLSTLTLAQLGDLEVTTASKEPEVLRRTPAAIHVITQEDIRRYGATSIAEVLRLAPGVNVARIDSDHWSIGVRGFGDQFSKSLLVMIDGRSVYTPLFAGIMWGVQDTLLDDIERIEIIRGPGGTIWGANAVTGIINIITKNAADTTGLLGAVGAGSLDRAVAGFRYGGARGSDLSYRVYGKGFNRGPEFHTDSQEFDTWHMVQFGGRADWAGVRDAITVQADGYQATEGQSVGLGVYSPPSQHISYDPVDLVGGNILARWRRAFSGDDDLRVQMYYDRTRFAGPQIGETRNTFDADLVHRIGALPRQSLQWGLGLRVSPSRITQTVPTLNVTPQQHTDTIYSAYVQDEVAVVANRLWATAGSKIEHNTYTGVEVQPGVRLLWTPTNRRSVWTGVTRAVRTPSRLESGLELTGFLEPSTPTFVRVLGDPAFRSERLLSYEAGYRQEVTPRFYIDVAGFHNRHADLESFGDFSFEVETSPGPARLLFVVPYANGVKGQSTGIEFFPDWRPADVFQLKGSYSYLNIDAQNQPGNADTTAVTTYEGSSPRHQVVVRPLLAFANGWKVDWMYRYVSALPARSVAAYHAADARVAWQATRDIEVAFVGQNLGRAHHLEFAHDPGPAVGIRRSAYATITWRR